MWMDAGGAVRGASLCSGVKRTPLGVNGWLEVATKERQGWEGGSLFKFGESWAAAIVRGFLKNRGGDPGLESQSGSDHDLDLRIVPTWPPPWSVSEFLYFFCLCTAARECPDAPWPRWDSRGEPAARNLRRSNRFHDRSGGGGAGTVRRTRAGIVARSWERRGWRTRGTPRRRRIQRWFFGSGVDFFPPRTPLGVSCSREDRSSTLCVKFTSAVREGGSAAASRGSKAAWEEASIQTVYWFNYNLKKSFSLRI